MGAVTPTGYLCLDRTTFRACRQNFIDIGVGVVDSDYWGEIKVVLFNHSAEDFAIKVKWPDLGAQLINPWENRSSPSQKDGSPWWYRPWSRRSLGVLAPSNSLNPLIRRTKWAKRKRILYPQYQVHNSGKHKTRLVWWSVRCRGLLLLSWLARWSTNGWEVVSPNSVLEGAAVEVGESTKGVDSSSKTP